MFLEKMIFKTNNYSKNDKKITLTGENMKYLNF